MFTRAAQTLSDLYIMNPDPSPTSVRIASDVFGEATFSAKRDKVAFIGGGRHIYAKNSDGSGTAQPLTSDPSMAEYDPSWSPGANHKIAFSRWV